MFVVFVAHLARPGEVEADVIAPRLGITPYEARLALAPSPPVVLQSTTSRDRANDLVAMLRSRGHGAHAFDDEQLVPSERMTRIDDFRLDGEGVRRETNGDLLPFGDVFAILRAVHDSSSDVGHEVSVINEVGTSGATTRVVSKVEQREHVAYFFRRSGERPWLLRERHTSFVGLGTERTPVAYANFTRLLVRIREYSPMAIFDDRLVRRRVVERTTSTGEGIRTSRGGMDLLAHLLAYSIANQAGSPYR